GLKRFSKSINLPRIKQRAWDKIVLDHKKARDFQLWNFSFLILSRSLIVF
ncbi:hypothetical protein CGSSpBS458_08551, partial [Streptococcus pneumoniae BS458]